MSSQIPTKQNPDLKMNQKKIVVAIDGPAGAGKSTVAKMVAEALGLRVLDTGAMYRCVALLASRAGLSAEQGEQAANLAREADIGFEEAQTQRVILNGEDVSEFIRTPEMSNLASALSAFPAVRQVLVEQQKKIIELGGFVLEGRDTTTVIAPNAEVKVYLTASIEERANRRHKELAERGDVVDYDALVKQIAERDARDMNREDSPLRKAPGALAIETYGMSPKEVATKIIEAAQAAGNKPT